MVKGYSTLCSNHKSDFKSCLPSDVKLAPWWVTGIIDSEGNISIMVQKTNSGHKISLAIKVTQKEHSLQPTGLVHKPSLVFGLNRILSKRFISTGSGNNSNKLKPVAYYSNAGLLKKEILKDNRGKSGVYRWTNLKTNNSYVGSSIDLYGRFVHYFNHKKLTKGKESNMVICKAILKHSYSSFSLEILEYCEKENVLAREQYYLDLIQPEYNSLKIAGSPAGYKHTDAARAKMRGKRVYSVEHIAKLRERALINSAAHRIKVEVDDREKNVITMYDSLTAAAKALDCQIFAMTSYEKTKAEYLLK